MINNSYWAQSLAARQMQIEAEAEENLIAMFFKFNPEVNPADVRLVIKRPTWDSVEITIERK